MGNNGEWHFAPTQQTHQRTGDQHAAISQPANGLYLPRAGLGGASVAGPTRRRKNARTRCAAQLSLVASSRPCTGLFSVALVPSEDEQSLLMGTVEQTNVPFRKNDRSVRESVCMVACGTATAPNYGWLAIQKPEASCDTSFLAESIIPGWVACERLPLA